MAFSSICFIYNNNLRPTADWYSPGTVICKEEIKKDFARKMLSDGSQNSACLKILRGDLIRQNGITFPVGIKIGEDKLFVLEFLHHCSSAVCAGNCGYYYLNVETSAMHSDSKMLELLATDENEIKIFTSFGLEYNTVRIEKSAFLFYELADFLQRCCSKNMKEAKAAAKLYFANTELMSKLDLATDYIKENNGTIYSLLATAFRKRSVPMTLMVLFIQKIINSRRN